MKIKSIYINEFGNLKDLTINFKEGLNSYLKPNGGGKTTLSAFIKMMLYGSPTANIKDIENEKYVERLRFNPIGSNAYGGNIVFYHNSKEYKIERTFNPKSLAHDKIKLYEDNILLKDFDTQIKLDEKFLDTTKDSFERFYLISQKDIDMKLTDSVATKIDKDFNNYKDFNLNKKLDDFEKKYIKEYDLNSQSKKTKMYTLINDIKETKIKLNEITEFEKELSLKNELKDKNLEKLSKYLNVYKDLNKISDFNNSNTLDKNNIIELTKAKDKLHIEIKELDKLSDNIDIYNEEEEELTSKINNLTIIVDKQIKLSNIDSELRRSPFSIDDENKLNKLENLFKNYNPVSINEIYKDINKLNVLENKEILPKNNRVLENNDNNKTSIFLKILIILSPIILFFGIISILFLKILGIILLSFGSILFLLTGFLYLNNKLSRQTDYIKEQSEKLYKEKNKLEYTKNKKEIEALNNKLKSFFNKYNINNNNYNESIIELKVMYNDYINLNKRKENDFNNTKELRKRKEEIEKEIRILNKENLDKDLITQLLKEKNNELTNIIANKKSVIDRLDYYDKKNNDLKEIIKKMEALENNINNRKDTINKLETKIKDETDLNNIEISKSDEIINNYQIKDIELTKEINDLKIKISPKNYYENLLDDLNNKKDEYFKKFKLNTNIYNELKKAQSDIIDEYFEPIKNKFTKYSNLIKQALGKELSLNEEAKLYFTIKKTKKQDYYLSAGERAIAAFCYRLSIIDIIEEKTKSDKNFIIMDDPFLELDNDMFNKTKTLIKTISKTRQILYLTCHKSREIN